MFIRRDLQKETRELNECFLRWNFYFTKDQNRFFQKQFAIREFVNYESYFALCDLLVANMRELLFCLPNETLSEGYF